MIFTRCYSSYVDTATDVAKSLYAAADDADDSEFVEAACAVAYLGTYTAEAEACMLENNLGEIDGLVSDDVSITAVKREIFMK